LRAGARAGRFKIANSWGVGGNWERVPDGFLWMTFEAMVANRVFACFYEDRPNYCPVYLAVFRIDHPVREDCRISVYLASGPNGTRVAQKRFEETEGRGGPHPFPANPLVMDISEFGTSALNGYDLFLEVTDSASHAQRGTVVSFQVERHDRYPCTTPAVLASASSNVRTVNGGSVVLSIDTAPDRIGSTPAAIRDRALSLGGPSRLIPYLNRRTLSRAEIDRFKGILGVYREGESYNPIVNGHGTGLRPPTEEEWSAAAAQVLTVDSLTPRAEQEGFPDSVDLSLTPFFPPIGNQGREGSCTSFSIVYYIHTFQEALERGWRLDSTSWIGPEPGGPSGNQDRIFSPEFVFSQINDGTDSGSAFSDNIQVVSRLGAATWQTCPYRADPGDFSWPGEAAWREAPLYRGRLPSNGGYGADCYWLNVEDYSDIDIIKSLLAHNIPVSIGVDARQYASMTKQDTWTIDNYNRPQLNHANTIVGYTHE
jgi:hypothetical protein